MLAFEINIETLNKGFLVISKIFKKPIKCLLRTDIAALKMAFNFIIRILKGYSSDIIAFIDVFIDILNRLDIGVDLNINISAVLL